MNESFGSCVPAFQACNLFPGSNYALTRVAIDRRRFAPPFFAHLVESPDCQSLPDQPRRGGTMADNHGETLRPVGPILNSPGRQAGG